MNAHAHDTLAQPQDSMITPEKYREKARERVCVREKKSEKKSEREGGERRRVSRWSGGRAGVGEGEKGERVISRNEHRKEDQGARKPIVAYFIGKRNRKSR